MTAFIVAPLVVGLLLFCVFAVLFMGNRMGRVATPGGEPPSVALKQLAARTNATGSDPMTQGGAQTFEAHGLRFRITASDFGKSGPETYWVGATLPAADGGGAYRGGRARLTEPIDRLPDVVCRTETGLDRLGKRLGLDRELESGDAAFDRAVYLESTDRSPSTAPLLAMIASTGAAHDVTAIGGHLVLAREGHDVAIRLVKHGQAFGADALDRAVEAIATVAHAMPPVRERAKPARRRSGALSIVFGVLLATVSATFGLGIALDMRVFGVGFVGYVASIAAGVFALVAVVLFVASRGRPTGFARFAKGIALSVALVPSLTAGSLVLANRIGDESTRRVRAPFVEKRLSKGKNSTTYYVTLGPWPGHADEEEIKVSRDAYDKTGAGATYELELGDGRLGYAWLRGAYLVE